MNEPGVQKAWMQFQKRLEKIEALQQAHNEKLQFDASYLPYENAFIAGTDEAGRGPLAGPVVTAAVILPNYCRTAWRQRFQTIIKRKTQSVC